MFAQASTWPIRAWTLPRPSGLAPFPLEFEHGQVTLLREQLIEEERRATKPANGARAGSTAKASYSTRGT
jgi:hypothetical protein